VADPYVPLFLGLLLVYAVYSAWVRLDPRLPFVAALVVLSATAATDLAGNVGAANVLAELALALFGTGVLLLLVARVRRGGVPSAAAARDPEPTDPTQERERATEEALDRPQQEAVPFVDAAGREHDEQEQARDREPDDG
jgi:hypothetical protein